MMDEGLSGIFRKVLKGLGSGLLANAASGFDRVEGGVLEVAMAVAALDGEVSAGELEEFENLARQREGVTDAAVNALFERCLRTAGYVEIQARRLEQPQLLELFANEAMKMLPDAFFRGDMEVVRRAFAAWTLVAMSDDYYSGVERKAIKLLRERIEGAVAAADAGSVPLSVASLQMAAGVTAAESPQVRVVPTEEFLARLEGVIARLKHEATMVKAREDLEQLIKG